MGHPETTGGTASDLVAGRLPCIRCGQAPNSSGITYHETWCPGSPDFGTPKPAPEQGWLLMFRSAWACPRCNAVNAPHVDQCPCRLATHG